MVQTSGNTADNATTQPSITDILSALRSFLLAVLPQGTPVLRGQQNRVVAPVGLFGLITPLGCQPLAQPAQTYTAESLRIATPQENSVQLSLFGPGAADAVQAVSLQFRTEWACIFFKNLENTARLAPLYASAPRQVPFVSGEQQFEEHWQITLHCQSTQVLVLPQATATAASIGLTNFSLSLQD